MQRFIDLFENSLYTDATSKADLIGDSKKLMSAFWINFLGGVGLYILFNNNPQIKKYFKEDKKLRIDDIGDDNNDFSLVLSLIKNNLRTSTINKITRFFVKLKMGDAIDEKIFKDDIFQEVFIQLINQHKAAPKVQQVLKSYEKGTLSLEHVVGEFYALTKRFGYCDEYKMLCRKAKINLSKLLKDSRSQGTTVAAVTTAVATNPVVQAIVQNDTDGADDKPAKTPVIIAQTPLSANIAVTPLKPDKVKKPKNPIDEAIAYVDEYLKNEPHDSHVYNLLTAVVNKNKYVNNDLLNYNTAIEGTLELIKRNDFDVKKLRIPEIFYKILNKKATDMDTLCFFVFIQDKEKLKDDIPNSESQNIIYREIFRSALIHYENIYFKEYVHKVIKYINNYYPKNSIFRHFFYFDIKNVECFLKMDVVPHLVEQYKIDKKSVINILKNILEGEESKKKLIIEYSKDILEDIYKENGLWYLIENIKDVNKIIMDLSSFWDSVFSNFSSVSTNTKLQTYILSVLPNKDFNIEDAKTIALNNLKNSSITFSRYNIINHYLGAWNYFNKDSRITELFFSKDFEENYDKKNSISLFCLKTMVDSSRISDDEFSDFFKYCVENDFENDTIRKHFESILNIDRFLKIFTNLYPINNYDVLIKNVIRFLRYNLKSQYIIPKKYAAKLAELYKDSIVEIITSTVFDISSTQQLDLFIYFVPFFSKNQIKECLSYFEKTQKFSNKLFLSRILSNNIIISDAMLEFINEFDEADLSNLSTNIFYNINDNNSIELFKKVWKKSPHLLFQINDFEQNIDKLKAVFDDPELPKIIQDHFSAMDARNEGFRIITDFGVKALDVINNIKNTDDSIKTIKKLNETCINLRAGTDLVNLGCLEKIVDSVMMIYDKDSSKLNDIMNIFDDKSAKKIFNIVQKNAAISPILENIHNTSPIVPIAKMDYKSIKIALKYNNFNIEAVGKIRKNRNESYGDYLKRTIEEISKMPDLLPKQNVQKVEITEKDLAQFSFDCVKNKHAGVHGSISVEFLEAYDVTFPTEEFDKFREEWKDKGDGIMFPMYHGCSGLAASMITRFGFAVMSPDEIQKAVGKYAGSALGLGIYCAPNIDKITNYVGDSNYGMLGQVGYVFEMDFTLGERYKHYDKAGTGDVTDKFNFRSPEYCAYYPRDQYKIVRCYKGVKSSIKQIIRKAKKHDLEIDPKYMKMLSEEINLMENEDQTIDELGYINFIFMDNEIPYDENNVAEISYLEFDDDIQVSFWNGETMISIPNNIGLNETYKIAITLDELYQRKPFIMKYIDMIKGKVKYIGN